MDGIYQAGRDFVKTLSNALDVADDWMQEAFNETSSEMSEQAEEDGPGNKYCQPDANGHVEVKCNGVEVAAAEIGETSQFVNTIDDDSSMVVMTPEVNVNAASLTQDHHWEEIDGDPPNLMPGVDVDMDNVPGRIQDFCPACL